MNSKPLSQVPAQATVRVTHLDIPASLRARLMGMGLAQGSEITVLHNRRGDVVVARGRTRLSVSQAVADAVRTLPAGVHEA
jgi:Fe2+ transport system protein FeoA